MSELIKILHSRYADSVMLMNIAESMIKLPQVEAIELVMGTQPNLTALKNSGFTVSEEAGKNDLIIAVRGSTDAACYEIIEQVMNALDRPAPEGVHHYKDILDIDLEKDPYHLVQISLPGEYAVDEIKKAITLGLDVMVFSDNVPLDKELEVKRLGRDSGVLVMGPDCGVGLIDGITLAAGSMVSKGPVGIVGASGSGAQEVACIIERYGSGVSSIIGTGGRDLYPEIGGITMRMGMNRLEQDPDTKVICLVSKLADRDVMDQILSEADMLSKPVVAVFLGADRELYAQHRVYGAMNLEEAAFASLKYVTGAMPITDDSTEEMIRFAKEKCSTVPVSRKYFRGLYCGGTFTEETMLHFAEKLPDVTFYSNLDTKYTAKLSDPFVSTGHAILDLGAEDFTAEAPHPVFDPTLRIKRLEEELKDPEVAVVLLDFITGPGVHNDPIDPFAAVCEKHPEIIFLACICGSENDPQNIRSSIDKLEKAGVLVARSNFHSALLAASIIRELESR